MENLENNLYLSFKDINIQKYVRESITMQKGDLWITAFENGMQKECPAGSRMLIRQVQNWRGHFGYGDIFVILLTDGRRLIKKIMPYKENTKDFVLCTSDNLGNNEPLPKAMIQEVWKVITTLKDLGW